MMRLVEWDDGLAIGLKPQRLVGEVIEDIDAKPVRQPRAVDDETYWRPSERLARHHSEKFIPLAVSHIDESKECAAPAIWRYSCPFKSDWGGNQVEGPHRAVPSAAPSNTKVYAIRVRVLSG